MEFTFSVQGFVIGFTAAAAIGPIAILLIQRTLARGWRYGAVSGVGVALADGLYGLIGGLGLTVITEFLIGQQNLLRVAGGMVLVYLGVKACLSKQAPEAVEEREVGVGGYFGALVSMFLLTLSNAVTILFFAAVYAGLGAGGISPAPGDAALFALGVFSGSLSWWVILSTIVNTLRRRFKPEGLAWLNKLSGLVIAGFGVWVLAGAVL